MEVPLHHPLQWDDVQDITPGVCAVIYSELAAINTIACDRWRNLLLYWTVGVQLPIPICHSLLHAMQWGSTTHNFSVRVDRTFYSLMTRINLPHHHYCIEVQALWSTIYGAHSDIVKTVPFALSGRRRYTDTYRLLHDQAAALVYDNCQVFLLPDTGFHGRMFELSHAQQLRLLTFIYTTLPSAAAVEQWISADHQQQYAIQREDERLTARQVPDAVAQGRAQEWAHAYDAEHASEPAAVTELRQEMEADLDFYCDSDDGGSE